jgi:hypothetical protein
MSDNSDVLLSKFRQLEGQFSTYHTNVERARRMYAREFENEVLPTEDDDIWVFLPPTARRAIDEPADHILPMPVMKVPVRPAVSDPIAQEMIAEKKRQFLNSCWRNIADRGNPFGDGRKLMLNEGRLCLRKTLKWNLVPEYPDADDADPAAKRKAMRKFRAMMKKLGHYDFLWDVEVLDTMSVYEDPINHRDPNYVFVEYRILLEEARRLFPESNADWTKGNDYSEVVYLEYWSKPEYRFDGTWEPGECVQWVNYERVAEKDSPYPYIPIAIEDSGFGSVYKGAKIHEKYVGISQHAFETFIAEARQMTSWENVTELTAFNPTITRNMDATKEIVVGPKRIISLEGGPEDPNRETIEFLQWPGLPLEVIQLAQRTNTMADEAVKMNTLGGIPLKGVETATEADQQVRNAASKLQGPVGGMERLANKLSSWFLIDVDVVIDAQVTVFGTGGEGDTHDEVTLGPSDINGFYRCSAELSTTDEYEASLSKARFWMDAYQRMPFLSAETAMVKGEVSDSPMQEMVQRAAEDTYLSPEMTGVRKLTGAQAFGEFASMFQQLIANKGGEGGGGGTPTGGQVNPQPVGGGSGDPRLNTFNAAEAAVVPGQTGPVPLEVNNRLNLQSQ